METIVKSLCTILLVMTGNLAMAQDFATAISGVSNYPLTFQQSVDYPWVACDSCVSSSNKVGLKESWFNTKVNIEEDSAIVSFDYKVQSWGWGETFFFSLVNNDSTSLGGSKDSTSLGGTEFFIQDGTDWTHFSYVMNKGSYTMSWNYSLSGGNTDAYAYVKNLYISGVSSTNPFLSISTTSFNFNYQQQNSVTKKYILITNSGEQDLYITGVSGLTGPLQVVSYPQKAISAGQKDSILVAFSPLQQGYWKQQLSIQSNGGSRELPVSAVCSLGYTVITPGAGSLSSVITNTSADSLTIFGTLNDNDFQYIRNNMPSLKYLNIKEDSVVNNRIPDYALQGNKTLQEVVLPKNLMSVGYAAFDQCTALNKVVFPNTLKIVENEGFSQCGFTGELTLPDSLVSIGVYSFDRSSITKIVFPDSLKTIGDGAFQLSELLTDVTLPPYLQSIGNSSFSECYRLNKAVLKGAVPPELGDNAFNYTMVFYVPKNSGQAYSLSSSWSEKIIIDGDSPVTANVTLSTSGTLGQEILKHLEYVTQVNVLNISGAPLNSDDYYQIQSRMPNLISIDMSNMRQDALPDNLFSGRSGLLQVKLPNSLKSIGISAFNRCYGLTSITLPDSLSSIGQNAFYNCWSLQHAKLPAQLSSLGYSAFNGCTMLQETSIPDGIKVIYGYTFYNCTALASVQLSKTLTEIDENAFQSCPLDTITFPNTLTTLRWGAFSQCVKLNEITLPASLQYCDAPFYNCSNIKRITCLASVPPTLENEYDILYNVDKSACPLLVPFWSVNNYKLTKGWDAFPVIQAADYEADEITVTGPLTLAEGIRPTKKTNVNLYAGSQFTVKGTDAFSMTKFTQNHTLYKYYWSTDNSTYSSLLSQSLAMRSDSVVYKLSANGNNWFYLSFPFDAKISDMTFPSGVLYAIRKYDGATRAKDASVNWENMTNDSTLHAGEGYIVQLNNDVSDWYVKAINNENKNNLFSGITMSRKLNEYTSEFAHNCSWNFIGNPYPCFFDIRYMNFKAPLTVWNGDGYIALSPEDDNYILKPMQAFFVQKPIDMDSISFYPEGRQIDATIRADTTIQSQVRALRLAQYTSREIYNLNLSDSVYTDQTRIVINPSASKSYELTCDAAKFMSSNINVPQLFSIDSASMRYAINERPLQDGVIPLGIYVGKAGSYTFSLSNSKGQNQSVVLVDKLENSQVRLDQTDYTFTAVAGTYSNRFEIRFGVIINAIAGNAVSGIQVVGESGKIELTASVGDKIAVFKTNGELVKSTVLAASSSTIQLPPGFYIVKINNTSFKAIVKR